MGPLKHLLKETHRRSIWQVLAVYLAGAWLALEVVQGIVEAGNLPDWLPGMALVLLIIGLPIVVTTAFVQSGVAQPEAEQGGGVESEDGAPAATASMPADRVSRAVPAGEPSGARHLFSWRNAVLGGVGAFALWGVVAAVLMATGRAGPMGVTPEPVRASIAVLPFTSTRTDEQSESFTLGIHDDLLTQLSKVGSLRVISRTSVMEYRETTKNIREIGAELGVSTVLEGSIQRSGDRIRINAQLIDAETDAHLWAEAYDRTLTVENIFHIQRELAEDIATELQATLTPAEAESIDAPPTENLEAYDFYLRGNAYFARGPRSDDFEIALDMYGRAVELDPGFALAYARLALTHGFMYQLQGRERESIEASREAAERALALDPDLPEGHLAMGEYLYWGPRDFDGALREYDRAAAAGLNTYDLHHALGAVRRRTGDFEGSIESFQEAARLEPTSAHIYEDVGSTYQSMGRFREAEAELQRSIEMAPREGGSYWWMVNTVLARDGDLERAREVVERGHETVDGGLPFMRSYLGYLEGDWQATLEGLPVRPGTRLARARAHHYLGNLDEARPLWDELRAEGEAWVSRNPRSVDTDLDLAVAYAALGREAEAEAEIARVRDVVGADPMDGRALTFSEVFVYEILGDPDRAFEALERLFNDLPHSMPPRYVALFPELRSLHDDPRWGEMMERYRQPPS